MYNLSISDKYISYKSVTCQFDFIYPKLLIQTLAKLHQISSQCVIDSFASNAIAAAESGNSFH